MKPQMKRLQEGFLVKEIDVKFEDIQLSRVDLVIMYVIKQINEMIEQGLMEGSMFELTEKGEALLGDFVPTEEEIQACIESLIRDGYVLENPPTFH